jgi:hypothetical protein
MLIHAVALFLAVLFWIGDMLSALSAWLTAHWYLSLPMLAGICVLVFKMNRSLPNWIFEYSNGLLAWHLFGWKIGIVAVVAYWGVAGPAAVAILLYALNTRTRTDSDGRTFFDSLMRMRLTVWSLEMAALLLAKAALMLPQT